MGFEPTETELTGRVFMSLSEPAKALWFRAGHWCAAHGERLVSLAMVKGWGSTKRAADELTRVALWGLEGDDWMVPERRPPEPEPESVSSKRARAGRLGGLARASKQPSKTQANGEANADASQANSDFASVAKPGLVPPLASPSPDSESGFSSNSPDSSSFQLSSEGSEPYPARAPKKPKAERRKARHALPAEWVPNAKHLARATEQRLSAAEQANKFRSHAAATGRLMANWDAAFTMWLDRAPTFEARPAGAPPSRYAPRQDARTEAIDLNADHDTRARLEASRRVRNQLAEFDRAKEQGHVR